MCHAWYLSSVYSLTALLSFTHPISWTLPMGTFLLKNNNHHKRSSYSYKIRSSIVSDVSKLFRIVFNMEEIYPIYIYWMNERKENRWINDFHIELKSYLQAADDCLFVWREVGIFGDACYCYVSFSSKSAACGLPEESSRVLITIETHLFFKRLIDLYELKKFLEV